MKTENRKFARFWEDINDRIHGHPVITHNAYCKWFKTGKCDRDQVIDLFEQFAVFSKWFLLVQMMRLLNATDLDAETHARYILANELGVKINPDGSTEDQPFKTQWAHINWLRKTARPLGLDPDKLGSWETASPATRKFIQGLEETYGSKDGEVGRGASYAIESWAAWGIGGRPEAESHNFWRELISGLKFFNHKLKSQGVAEIPLDFFQFHFDSEKGHGDNVLRELKQSFAKPEFDGEKFIQAGEKALHAIHTFWLGLDESRQKSGSKKDPSLTLVGF